MIDLRTDQQQKAEASGLFDAASAHDMQPEEGTELPVPRVDDDDFAPTIVRGRE